MRINEGLRIPIDGEPEQAISKGVQAASIALLGKDYLGLSPTMRVQQGDWVKLGQPLFADRKNPDVVYTSPGSGIVVEINRGARRALLSVVVRLEGDQEQTFACCTEAELTKLQSEQVAKNLLASGLWSALRTRPYNKVADPNTTPHSIFVTAINSDPLAIRPEVVINEYRQAFANGLTVISRLVEGSVFVCKAPDVKLPAGNSEKISQVDFAGPHPSGLVGTHIHFLDPIGPQRMVWHLNYQDVIAIGKLFTTGRLWTERIISLAGSMVKKPRLVRARIGANTDDLTQGEVEQEPVRIISGSVLSGRWARKPENYLGRYHDQVSVIAENRPDVSDGWLAEDRDRYSIYGLFAVKPRSKRKYQFSTELKGKPTAMVTFGGFERVMPLDILPTQLLRALLVGDTEMARALGCLELDEEDLALCTFVCPSKLDYGPMLRAALEQIERQG